jgi:hypothetical protein
MGRPGTRNVQTVGLSDHLIGALVFRPGTVAEGHIDTWQSVNVSMCQSTTSAKPWARIVATVNPDVGDLVAKCLRGLTKDEPPAEKCPDSGHLGDDRPTSEAKLSPRCHQ